QLFFHPLSIVNYFIYFVIQSTFTMKEIQEYEKDLAAIRSLMEKSGKFISLSGMSGILAGLYALAGAAAVNWLLNHPASSTGPPMAAILSIAAIVLVVSIATGLALSGV